MQAYLKKAFTFILSISLIFGLVACQKGAGSTESTSTEGAAGSDLKINLYTRDSASGTREGFESIVGFKGELSDRANEVSSNGEMANRVSQDPAGIGYVSLSTDLEANHLKALQYEGVAASVETVNSGEYKLARPFSYVTRAEGDFMSPELEELTRAFISFITKSKEGAEIILAAGGIVDLSAMRPWAELASEFPVLTQDNSALTLRTAGSTSVEKTIKAALEAFQALAGNVQFKLNQTGSSDGWKRVLGEEKDGPNQAEIGFASREFKSEEDTSVALAAGQYCRDAIVIVVSSDGPAIENLSQKETQEIFTGAVSTWSQVGQK